MRFHKSNKGSSSVLVIMIMLTLVVFGTLAMTSAYSDLKLARKSVQWIESYYSLDAKGEIFMKSASDSLEAARIDTVAYISSEQYLKPAGTGLNAKIQAAVYQTAQTSFIAAGNDAYANLFRKLFFYYINDHLENYGYEVKTIYDFTGDVSIYAGDFIIPETGALILAQRESIKSDNDIQSLDIELDVTGPKGIDTDAAPYYKVIKWDHLQKQFDYTQKVNVWDGKVRN